jgi:hypothetical protein
MKGTVLHNPFNGTQFTTSAGASLESPYVKRPSYLPSSLEVEEDTAGPRFSCGRVCASIGHLVDSLCCCCGNSRRHYEPLSASESI